MGQSTVVVVNLFLSISVSSVSQSSALKTVGLYVRLKITRFFASEFIISSDAEPALILGQKTMHVIILSLQPVFFCGAATA